MERFYEIYLAKKHITKDNWLSFINKVGNISPMPTYTKLIITKDLHKIRFFIKTKYNLPSTINDLNSFLLEKTNEFNIPKEDYLLPYFMTKESSLIDLINHFEIKEKGNISHIEINIVNSYDTILKKKIYLYVKSGNEIIKYRIFLASISSLLDIDFEGNKRFQYKSIPKYLDISKTLDIFTNNSNNALLKINTFPYLNDDYYLNEFDYSFDKHSIIFGASGSGKSKFISLFINNLYQNNTLKKDYKFVIIDPHASLTDDIGLFSNVINFDNASIDLFATFSEDIIANTEIYLDLFKSLMIDQYNAKLERVLRYSTYLLLGNKAFNFTNLRNLLLDINYRNEMINKVGNTLPICVTNFFLNDFNELKTKSYSESISPIISFIDEMDMLPIFNNTEIHDKLSENIQNNFITLFSLDRTKLGDKITKTIAGLIMQNILNIIQSRKIKEHIIFVIDEVAIIENPILSRFLSEARKYNLSLVLAGQYFDQISLQLKDSIFANVSNYYLFRLSQKDATTFVQNIKMKIPIEDTNEKKVELLTQLANQTCLVRIEKDDNLLPAFMGTTMYFSSKPALKKEKVKIKQFLNIPNPKRINFSTNSKTSLKEILKRNSTSRKEIKNE